MSDDGIPRWVYAKPLSESERLRHFGPHAPVAPSAILSGPSYDVFAHYAHVRSLHDAYPLSTDDQCFAHIIKIFENLRKQDGRPLSESLISAILVSINLLLHKENIYHPILLPPPDDATNDYIEYAIRPQLRDAELFYSEYPRVLAFIEERIVEYYCRLLSALPDTALDPISRSTLTVPLIELVPNPDHLVLFAMHLFRCTVEPALPRAFTECDRQTHANLFEASGITEGQQPRRNQIVLPTHAYPEKDAVELVSTYLQETAFEDLLVTPVPFSIPDSIRFEHHWIVGGSGHGKTQALQSMIAADLPHVMEGSRSIIVIDSQGDLIRNISHLRLFHEHPDRLCLIDPTDIEYPVQLNLFSLGSARADGYSPVERERLQNGAIELYEYILDALLGAELTAKQSTLFRYVLRLLTVTDGATINTFRDIMDGHVPEKGLARVRPNIREFFAHEFHTSEYSQTKRQVVRRLWGILENQAFERMFSHAESKLDLFAEMNAGKVILINTSKDLLKEQGTKIFGRFFIALIAQAAQERANLKRRLPCFVYIDEAQDYFDDKVSKILEQARKFNVGMVLAHQFLGQLSSKLYESFAANTSIKYAGGVSDQDARAFARMMRSDHSFVEKQPKGSFAAFVRNYTDHAVSLRIPFRTLETMPQATADEYAATINRNRARYATRADELPAVAARTDEPPPAPTSPDTPRPAAPRRDNARPAATKPQRAPVTPERQKPTQPPPEVEDSDDWRS